MKTLILMRHGKAVREWEAPSDHARGLTERGELDALATSHVLKAHFGEVALALVSSSARTQGTWAAMAPTWPEAKLVSDSRLYLASDDVIADLAAGHAGACADGALLVIGHNPGLHDHASVLCEATKGHDWTARQRLAAGLRTAWAGVFQPSADDPGHLHLKAMVGPGVLECSDP